MEGEQQGLLGSKTPLARMFRKARVSSSWVSSVEGTLRACGVGWSEVWLCQGELQTLPRDSHTLPALSTCASHYPRTEGIFGVCIHLIQLQGPRRGIFLPASSKCSSASGQEREVWGER